MQWEQKGARSAKVVKPWYTYSVWITQEGMVQLIAEPFLHVEKQTNL